MVFPINVGMVAVHARFRSLADKPSTGRVDFDLISPAVAISDPLTAMPTRTTGTLSATGEFTVNLPASDINNPSPWIYRVDEHVTGSNGIPYFISLSDAPTTQEYADLEQVADPALDVVPPMSFYQLTDSAAVNNSTVLVDSALSILISNKTREYSFEALVFASSNATADLKIGWRSTAVGISSGFAWSVVADPLTTTKLALADTATVAGGAAAFAVLIKGSFKTLSAGDGTLFMQFAQATADVSDTKILAGSTIKTIAL